MNNLKKPKVVEFLYDIWGNWTIEEKIFASQIVLKSGISGIRGFNIKTLLFELEDD